MNNSEYIIHCLYFNSPYGLLTGIVLTHAHVSLQSQSLIVTLHHRIEALEKRFSVDMESGKDCSWEQLENDNKQGNRSIPQTQPKLTEDSLSQPQEEPRNPRKAKGGVREVNKNVSGSTHTAFPNKKSADGPHPLRKKRKI